MEEDDRQGTPLVRVVSSDRGASGASFSAPAIEIRCRGEVPYEDALAQMREHTDARSPGAGDELWLVEHPPVFTLGQAGDPRHVIAPGAIPVVRTDRGGQVTYHGPGQAVIYVLLELRRFNIGVRALVCHLEGAVIDVLASEGLEGTRRHNAPGVYVRAAKIAALGLRIRRGCTYHGIAINVDMDLEPFSRINPCGFEDLAVTDLRGHGIRLAVEEVGRRFADALSARLIEGVTP